MEPLFELEDPYLFWPSAKRFLFRLLFKIIIIGGFVFSLAFILFNIPRYFYLSLLILFFVIFLSIRQNFSDLSLLDIDNQNLKKINLSRFLSLEAKEVLIEGREISLQNKIPLSFGCLYCLLQKPRIIEALYYLDYGLNDIKEASKRLLESKNLSLPSEEIKTFYLLLLSQAYQEAQKLKRSSLDIYSLMLGLYDLDEQQINDFFKTFNFDKTDLEVAFSLNILSRSKNIEPISGLYELKSKLAPAKRPHINRSLTSKPTPLLESLGVDLTDLAAKRKIGVMIGHLKEYETLVNILARAGKKNVLLVGPSGIGKETIVSYLAYQLAKNEIIPQLKDFRLIGLSFSALINSTLTPFEACNKLTQIVDEVSKNPDIILYLPQLHNYKLLIQEGGLSALEILKPLFDSQQNPVIATTTDDDYRRILEQDSNLQDEFEVIRVSEVSPQEAIQILALQSLKWKRIKKIQVSYRAIKRAVFLAQRFLRETPLPSSAEALITEAIEGAQRQKKKFVGEEDIVNLVSVKTSIPLELSQTEEKEKLLDLEKIIHQSFINQEEAVQAVASALRQYRAGLSNPHRPIGVFLFVGPTGVGKTELSKILTKIYFGDEKMMIRFDMSEFQDPRGVFRFIGSPEGETSGVLTEAVKAKPFSLILLDEFEKAHPKVLDLFLPLFDEGRLTDNLGETIDFTNTIIIATSNALSDFIKDQIEKGTPFNQLTELLKQKLTNYFKPELLNRFDEVVIFRPLTEENLKQIVRLKLNNLTQILNAKKIEIEFDESVIVKLAQLGYNPIFGARPLETVIRHFIKEQLARAILKNEIKPYARLRFVYQDNAFKFYLQ